MLSCSTLRQLNFNITNLLNKLIVRLLLDVYMSIRAELKIFIPQSGLLKNIVLFNQIIKYRFKNPPHISCYRYVGVMCLKSNKKNFKRYKITHLTHFLNSNIETQTYQ